MTVTTPSAAAVPVRIPIAKPLLGPEEEAAVAAVLRSGMLAHGPVTEDFERRFAAYVGAPHAVAVANGTAALHLALAAAGVGPGDEVLVPAFTFVATANAVLMVGARPVFVDVDPATFTMDPADARRALTPRTKALLPVHLYGLAADLDPLLELAAGRDLALVEDCAQSHGATYRGKVTGSLGDLGCFSFYPTKNLAVGEGGMVTTADPEMAELVASLRNHGRGQATLGTYDHVRMGWNLRTTDVLSAIGREQLAKLPAFTRRRQEVAARLDAGLRDAPGVTVPTVPAGRTHVYHQYTVRCADRAAVQARLRAAGIGSGVYYPKVQYAYPHLAAFARACPQAERAAREVLSLPVHPSVSDADADAIVRAVRG